MVVCVCVHACVCVGSGKEDTEQSVVVSIFVYVYSAWFYCCLNCVHFHLLCPMRFRLTLVAGPCKYFYVHLCGFVCVCVNRLACCPLVF